jgi:hypothetical protein
MTSAEKVLAFKHALMGTEEEFDGLLGAVQGLVAMDVLSGRDAIENEIVGLGHEKIDEELLNVAGFVLWLRSDDAPAIDAADLVDRMPAEIAELVANAGIATS